MLKILRKLVQIAGTVAAIGEMVLAALGTRKQDQTPLD
jgi:hypothetical protein